MKKIIALLLMSFGASVQAAPFVVETPPTSAVNCAAEGALCTLPTGTTATVWYGQGDQWITLQNQAGEIACSETTFGATPNGDNNTCVYAQAALANGLFMQAEDAALNGPTIESGNAGAFGTYVDFQNPSGDTITWTVEADTAGYAPLDIRYALAGSSRAMTLKVNGEIIDDNFNFATTWDWAYWVKREVNVSLQAGTNTITLEANGDSGPNFDSLMILGSTDAPKLDIQIGRTAIHAEDIAVFHQAGSGTNADIIDLRQQTVTVTNTTEAVLNIAGLSVSGAGFSLVDADQANGSTLNPGESLDIAVQFNQSRRSVFIGYLAIFMEDSLPAAYRVPLRGLWNPGVCCSYEPTIADITNVFGWANKADGTILNRSDINFDGVPTLIDGELTIEINGETQQAYYFEAADPDQPVTIQQVAAFHINGGRSVLQAWSYDYDATLGELNEAAAYTNETSILYNAHDAKQGNTLLQYQLEYEPALELTRPLLNSINPEGPFALTLDALHTDPARNQGYQAVRILALYDQATGLRFENTYLLTMDYSGPGANYDYNDNVYIVTNIKPFDGEITRSIPPAITLEQPLATSPGFVSGSIAAQASDADGTVASVAFYYNGDNLIETVTEAPYQLDWAGVADGTYTLKAVATDDQGLTTESNVVTVVIDAAAVNEAPTVTLNPAQGSAGNVSGSITATASDADGSISKVEIYYNGDNLLATLEAAPYTVNWADAPNGTYELTAIAYDDVGVQTTSNVVTVTVDTTLE